MFLFKIKMVIQVFFSKNSKILKFRDKVALGNCIKILVNFFASHSQKYFVSGSLYPFNLIYMVVDGPAMVV